MDTATTPIPIHYHNADYRQRQFYFGTYAAPVYFHEGQMFFGKDKAYDSTEADEMMKDLNERKEKYPRLKHPY